MRLLQLLKQINAIVIPVSSYSHISGSRAVSDPVPSGSSCSPTPLSSTQQQWNVVPIRTPRSAPLESDALGLRSTRPFWYMKDLNM